MYLKQLLVFLFIWIGFLASAQKIDFNQGSVEPKKHFEEISFDLVYDKIVIPVKINNKTYRFLLDTGAPNLISYEVYNEIQAQKLKSVEVSDANENKDSLKLAVLESIEIGSIHYKNTMTLVSDLSQHPILKCYQIDGFIGSNLLKNSILKLSLNTNTITLTDDVKLLQPKSKPVQLKLVGVQKAPYITIKLNKIGKKYAQETLLFDSGMDGFYEMSTRAHQIFSREKNVLEELSRSKGAAGMGLFGIAEESEHILFRIPNMHIAGSLFENVVANTTEDNNSRLGLEVLKYGDIIIDFKSKKFYFEAPEKTILKESIPRIHPTFIEDTFVVGFVWDEALQNDIRYGDEILSIDNQLLSELELCDIIALRKKRDLDVSTQLEIKNKENQVITITIQP